MRFKAHLNSAFKCCTIPLSQLHTLKEELSLSLHLPTDYLDENILWDIREGRLGGEPQDIFDEKNTTSMGKRGVSPIVTAFLSDDLTRILARSYDFMSPLHLLDSGPRSMRWQVILVPDALETIHEYPFMDARGYLRVMGKHPLSLRDTMIEIIHYEETPPSNPTLLVKDEIPVTAVPQTNKFVHQVSRQRTERTELIPNILWRHKPELDKLYREHRASK